MKIRKRSYSADLKERANEALGEIVNHPAHYQGNKFEVIDIIEDFGLGFCLGNAIKYILRAGKKNDVLDARDLDLKKAAWYINRVLEQGKE